MLDTKENINTVLHLSGDRVNPAQFLGRGWDIWKGPVDGDGLDGAEYRDHANDKLIEIDFAQVVLTTCLNKGESRITVTKKLQRLEATPSYIRLGTRMSRALLDDYRKKSQSSILEWLHLDHQINRLEFLGDILRSPDGNQSILYLFNYNIGWSWDTCPLQTISMAPMIVLPSSSRQEGALIF